MENIIVPFVPLEEQGVIARFLDRETAYIDKLIAERQTFIELLKEKRQAFIIHVVTKGPDPNVKFKDSGIEWIGEVPEGWFAKKIKYDVVKIEQGWSHHCENTPVIDDESRAAVKVGCVNAGLFSLAQNKKLPEELEPKPEHLIRKRDLLVLRANAKEWVGRATVVHEEYPKLMLCDKIYRVGLNFTKVNPNCVAYYLGCDKAREQIEIDATGTSSSMLNRGQGTILDMPIVIPSLDEQIKIIEYLSSETEKNEKLKHETQSSIDLLMDHRTSNLSAAVTGTIDVRNHKEEAA